MRCDGCVQTLKAPRCYSYRINSCKSLLCKRQRPKTPDWRHVLDRAWGMPANAMPTISAMGVSNCLESQVPSDKPWAARLNGLLSRTMAFKIVSSFRMHATNATFLSLPAVTKRS